MEQARIDVAYIAKLAKLELSEDECARFSDDLNKLLAYVDQLGQWDITGVEPMSHPLPVFDAMRADVPGGSLPIEEALRYAPAQDENQILVPKVVESAH